MITDTTYVGIKCVHVRTTSGPCSCAAAVSVQSEIRSMKVLDLLHYFVMNWNFEAN
jgi:hypothetical protein